MIFSFFQLFSLYFLFVTTHPPPKGVYLQHSTRRFQHRIAQSALRLRHASLYSCFSRKVRKKHLPFQAGQAVTFLLDCPVRSCLIPAAGARGAGFLLIRFPAGCAQTIVCRTVRTRERKNMGTETKGPSLSGPHRLSAAFSGRTILSACGSWQPAPETDPPLSPSISSYCCRWTVY